MMRVVTFRLLLLMTASLALESVDVVPGSSSVSRLLGVLAAGAWLLTVFVNGRIRQPHLLHVVALLFLLWNACSLLWTVDGPATQTRVVTYAQLFVLLLIVWETVTTTRALRQVLLADLVGCYIAAAVMVVAYAMGSASEVHGRVTVGNFNPNDVGMILAFGIPIACYFLGNPVSEPWRRPVMLLAATFLPLAGFAVLGTGSRAALVAVVPSVWYAGRLMRRSHPAVGVASLLGCGVLVVATLPLLPARAVQRLGETGDALMQGNLNERQLVWAEAIRIIHEEPWTGVGANAFRTAAVGVNKVGHNFVFALMAEVGVVGLGLFVLMFVVAVRSLRFSPSALRELWYVLVVAWACAGLLHNWEHRKLTWLFLGLMVATGALAASRPVGGEDRAASARSPSAADS
jgi:O-antigen ligase